MKRFVVAVMMVLLAVPLFAQKAESEDRPLAERLRERIERAIQLPESADEARDAGIPEDEVKKVLDEARRRRLPVEEVDTILVESAASARVDGPVDNFGAFVQSQLDNGLRGRDLADAIHREHAARGRGPKRDKMDAARGKGKGKGKKDKYKDDDDYKDHDKNKEHDKDKDKDLDEDDHADDDKDHIDKKKKARDGRKKENR